MRLQCRFFFFLKIVTLHDLRQKSVNISALAQWILNQVPVLETPLKPTWIFKMPNHDWMSNFWSKKPPESREGEIVMIWFTKGLATLLYH